MMNLFILEDETFIRDGLEYYFKKNFKELLNIISFSNGEELMSTSNELVPDIIISDINLPGINGIETIRSLQEQYDFKAIFLSGYNDYHYLRSAIHLGVEDYLLKPVDYVSLKKLVLSYIDDKQSNLYEKNKRFLMNMINNNPLNEDVAQQVKKLEYDYFHVSLSTFYDGSKVPSNGVAYTIPLFDEEIIVVNAMSKVKCTCKYCFSFNEEEMEHLSKYVKDLLLLKDIHMKQKELYYQFNDFFINFNNPNEMKDLLLKLEQATTIKQKSDIILVFLIQYMSNFKDLSNFDLLKKIANLTTQNYLTNEDIDTIIANYIKPLILNLTKDSSSESLFTKEVIQYIDTNYKDPALDLNSLSSIFNKSSANLSIIIKKALQKNFTVYLNELRIEKAKQLLVDTKIRINDVSREVGYNNEEYFTKVFKKYTGVTPLKFRNLHTP
ncbi:response regulator transcription factor [Lysinibacillus endophyticus]|uniref:response regulator transcription factor n=1 Tax=Ureibacillus endophyticus TaxID=1978490 RepID=UPI00209C8ACB|nr:response regulator [Lysinibacillus endophyticus]MCP1146649.1 response regulator [Lysinibacillus endophyticus]